MVAGGRGTARTTGGRRSWHAARDRLGPACFAFFAIVVLAAGASAVALLVAPGSTGSYFSWTLRPAPAAALIGGLYLASAVVFAWGLTLPLRQARSLLVGVLGLAIPTLVLTVVHDEVFDFARWQAVAWVVLFVTAPISASALLLRLRGAAEWGPRLRGWCRVVLVVLAASLLGLAVAIWVDTVREDILRFSPVDLVRLTGAYLGAWCSFLAVLCGWAAVTGRWDDGRVALVTVGVASAGIVVGLLRSIGHIRHPVVALVASAGLAVLALSAAAANRPAVGHEGRAAAVNAAIR